MAWRGGLLEKETYLIIKFIQLIDYSILHI